MEAARANSVHRISGVFPGAAHPPRCAALLRVAGAMWGAVDFGHARLPPTLETSEVNATSRTSHSWIMEPSTRISYNGAGLAGESAFPVTRTGSGVVVPLDAMNSFAGRRSVVRRLPEPDGRIAAKDAAGWIPYRFIETFRRKVSVPPKEACVGSFPRWLRCRVNASRGMRCLPSTPAPKAIQVA
ncbi:hypothetical protein BH20ACT10_BH20ACT10_16660 [soil metagenome]|jgi:hypothetical protein